MSLLNDRMSFHSTKTTFVDDTTVVGLIAKGNESTYGNEVLRLLKKIKQNNNNNNNNKNSLSLTFRKSKTEPFSIVQKKKKIWWQWTSTIMPLLSKDTEKYQYTTAASVLLASWSGRTTALQLRKKHCRESPLLWGSPTHIVPVRHTPFPISTKNLLHLQGRRTSTIPASYRKAASPSLILPISCLSSCLQEDNSSSLSIPHPPPPPSPPPPPKAMSALKSLMKGPWPSPH